MPRPRKFSESFQAAALGGKTGTPGPYVRPQGETAETAELTVFETPELKGFEQSAEEAIFILSQSATGRRLMQTAIAADYGVVFVEDPDKNLRGYVDWEQKIVFLAKESDPRLLALTLGHELAHVSQHVNGGADINVIKDHPLSALKKFLAIEADARAYEIMIALELEYPAPSEDKNRICFEGMAQIAAIKTDIEVMPKLVASIAPRLAEGSLAKDRAMAACFRAFYYDIALRATYENRLMTRIEGLDKTIITATESFAQNLDSAAFIARLDGHDVAYMLKNADVTNIDDPQLAAVCARTAERLRNIQSLRAQNDNTPDADANWKAPVYAPAPRKPQP